MTAVCRFCNQEFSNSQAVRAHLKGCDDYHRRRTVRRASGNNPSGNARSLGNSLGAPVECHNYLDPTDFGHDDAYEDNFQTESAQLGGGYQRATYAREDQDVRNLQQREAASRRRREIIQAVKQQTITEAGAVLWHRPEAKADALLAIERALAGLEVQDLPHEELLTIARSERDRLYHAAERNEKQARDAESLIRKRAEEVAERKNSLRLQGAAYAKQELDSVDDMKVFERWRVERRVDGFLQSIGGNEPWTEIQALIEEILASEGIEEADYEDDT